MESDELDLLIQRVRCIANKDELINHPSSKSNLASGSRPTADAAPEPIDKNSVPSNNSKMNVRSQPLKNIWDKLDF